MTREDEMIEAYSAEEIAKSLMRTCYDEANRLANHGSSGLEKLVMTQLYDAANAAKARLNGLDQARAAQRAVPATD